MQRPLCKPVRPNESFKPNLLRYAEAVSERARHGFASTKQFDATQALGAF